MTANDWLQLGQMYRAGAREIRAYSDAPETNVIADSYEAMADYAETVAARRQPSGPQVC